MFVKDSKQLGSMPPKLPLTEQQKLPKKPIQHPKCNATNGQFGNLLEDYNYLALHT
jgi:hypothetical protein